MISVLAVDDEKIVRIALQTMLAWEEHGFRLVGTASDGLQALELAARHTPDIIVTDLKMPNLDGIELIKRLQAGFFTGKCLVLSNYGEFELVREAMKLGASDYLLKVTLEPEELLTALKRAAEQLAEQRKQTALHAEMKAAYSENGLRRRNAAWVDWLTAPERSGEAFGPESDGSELDGAAFDAGSLMVLAIDRYDAVVANGKHKDKELLRSSVINIIRESLAEGGLREIVRINDRTFVILMTADGRDLSADKLQLAAGRLQNVLRMYLNIEASIAIGQAYEGAAGLRKAYADSLKSLELRFYSGVGALIQAGEFENAPSGSRLSLLGMAKRIGPLLEENDVIRADAAMGELLDKAIALRYPPSELKKLTARMLDEWEKLVVTWGDESFALPAETLAEMAAAEEEDVFRRAALRALHLCASRLNEAKSRKFRKEIHAVIDYMQENLNARLTLAMIAGEVHLNESYLCRLFKQETGVSIFAYLNAERVKRAMELLKRPDAVVKEVAAEVGIDDPFYFNRLFKKLNGLSPSEYKKKMLSASLQK